MDAALVAAALLMGVSGAPHCAAMCAAPCAALVGTPGSARPWLALQVARVAGYAAAGAVAAAGVAGLGSLAIGAPVVRPVWALLQAGALVLGLWLLWSARAPSMPWSDTTTWTGTTLAQPIRWMKSMPATARAGAAGSLWFMLPCGLLQSALLVAALASSPLAGAAVMSAFATTSALGLWLAPQLWLRLRRLGLAEGLAAWSVRISGLLLAASSLFALWHGLGSAFCETVA